MLVNFIRAIQLSGKTLTAFFVIARFLLMNVLVLIRCSLTNMGTYEKIALTVTYHTMGLSNHGTLFKFGCLTLYHGAKGHSLHK